MNVYVYALIAAALFFIMSPGVLLTLPPNSGCGPFIQLSSSHSCATSYEAASIHALIFLIVFVGFIMWRKKAKSSSPSSMYMYALVAAVLFFAITPGVIITLPPTSGCGAFIQLNNNSSCASSYIAAGVHAIVYLIIFVGFIMYRRKFDQL